MIHSGILKSTQEEKHTSDVITVHIFVANRPNYVATVILISKLSKRAMKQDCMENTEKKSIRKIDIYNDSLDEKGPIFL